MLNVPRRAAGSYRFSTKPVEILCASSMLLVSPGAEAAVINTAAARGSPHPSPPDLGVTVRKNLRHIDGRVRTDPSPSETAGVAGSAGSGA